jgi:hypothetical protein
MPNYNLRRDKLRQKNTKRSGSRRWYKRVLHRFERRIAKIELRNRA